METKCSPIKLSLYRGVVLLSSSKYMQKMRGEEYNFYCCTVGCRRVDTWCRLKIAQNSLLACVAQSACFCGLAMLPADFTSGGVRVFMGFFLNCRKVRVRSWELRVNRSHLEKHLEKMKLSLDSEVYSSWPFLLILCSKFLILWHDRRGEPRPRICIWSKVIVAWGLRYTSLGRSSLCHGLSSDSHVLLALVLLGPFRSRLQACISQQSWDSSGELQEALWFSNIVLTMTVDQKVTNWADPGSMCKDTAGRMVKESFRSPQLHKLLSSSYLSFFLPWHLSVLSAIFFHRALLRCRKKKGKNIIHKIAS